MGSWFRVQAKVIDYSMATNREGDRNREIRGRRDKRCGGWGTDYR